MIHLGARDYWQWIVGRSSAQTEVIRGGRLAAAGAPDRGAVISKQLCDPGEATVAVDGITDQRENSKARPATDDTLAQCRQRVAVEVQSSKFRRMTQHALGQVAQSIVCQLQTHE